MVSFPSGSKSFHRPEAEAADNLALRQNGKDQHGQDRGDRRRRQRTPVDRGVAAIGGDGQGDGLGLVEGQAKGDGQLVPDADGVQDRRRPDC